MTKLLTALSLLSIALCSCESSFPEPEYPIEETDQSESVAIDEGTRNDDDSAAARGITIVVEDENEVDIDWSL